MSGLSIEQEHQIKELLSQNQKITAIKLYCEITNATLKDAKDSIESIERGTPINFFASAQVGEPDTFLENRIKRLLAERKKIEAVKVYREAYNCGLKEAKDAVDLIQAGMRREGYSNLPTASSISNDPFADDTQRNRSYVLLVIALSLVLLGGLAFFFFMRNGL